MYVVYSDDLSWTYSECPYDNIEHYPEHKLTIEQQLNYVPDENTECVVTNSPFILAAYDSQSVFVRNSSTNVITLIDFQTYGADIGVIIKQLTELRSLQPRCVVNAIREKLAVSNNEALAFIEKNLGDSAEKAYLRRKLSDS